MLIFCLAIAAVSLCFAAATVIAGIKGRRTDRMLLKTIASMLFLFLGFVGLLFTRPGMYAPALFAALIACVAGDVFLAYYSADKGSPRPFLMGTAAFSAAHVFFSVEFIVSFGTAWPWNVIAAVVTAGVIAFTAVAVKVNAGKLLPAVFAYALIISFALSNAVCGLIKKPCLPSVLAVAGMVLFAASDVILMFKYFKKNSNFLGALNLSLYYPAVLILAMSATAL